jgi:hypothetical protein
MSVTLRPRQPNAVEDPERRLLANQAFVKAKVARSRPEESASSSSEDEADLIKNILQEAVTAGRVQPDEAEAAVAALAGRNQGTAETQPPAQEASAESTRPRKREAVRRITVDFLNSKGYFDRPIQASSACSMAVIVSSCSTMRKQPKGRVCIHQLSLLPFCRMLQRN